jgi:hypothetical protein
MPLRFTVLLGLKPGHACDPMAFLSGVPALTGGTINRSYALKVAAFKWDYATPAELPSAAFLRGVWCSFLHRILRLPLLLVFTMLLRLKPGKRV